MAYPKRSIVASIKTKPKRTSEGFTVEKLEQSLEKGYLLMAREPGFKTKKSFAPSSIGYQHATCPRYWHIAFTGAHFAEHADAVGVAVMSSGTSAHERIQTALEKAGIVIPVTEKPTRHSDAKGKPEHEAKLEDPPVFGYIDLLLDVDGEKVVGEIKTTGGDIFRYRSTSNKPAPYHMYQILLYMHITKIDRGFVMYEDRDTLQICVIEVLMDETNRKVIDDALDWMRKVRKNWEDEGEIPKAPWTQRNKSCKTCPVFETCWNSDLPVGSKEIGAMEVHKP